MSEDAATSTPSKELRFDVLFEADHAFPQIELPRPLREIYGGLRLRTSGVLANFVSSLDGAVALPAVAKSSSLISGGHPADRFVVALLRAIADAVVIGAGTYRQHRGPWTAATAYPDAGSSFAELRARLGSAPAPTLVVVTRSGDLGEPRPYLDGSLIVSVASSLERLEPFRAAGANVVALDDGGSIDPARLVELLVQRGYTRILTEGGPDLMGDLLRANLVDELFLTLSPMVVGGGDPPPATLTGGAELPAPLPADHLLGARRADDYLFLRYALRVDEAGRPARP
jgi:riboflavin biosynthesis pyrimidine reductase